MELRHLRYFQAVAEEANFHRAAAKLRVAQPALSRQIQALEFELGVKLFEREARGVRLSQVGKVLLEDTRRILDDIARMRERVRHADKGETGQLRIGFNQPAARHPFVGALLRTIRSRFPGIEMKLTLLSSERQLDVLHRGEIDAGFLFHRPVSDLDLDAQRIGVDDYGVVMPTSHPLVNKQPLHLADLKDEAFITGSPQTNKVLYGRLMAACFAAGFVPRQIHESDIGFSMIDMVAVGMGVAFINRSFNVQSKDVVLRVVEDLSVPVTLELVWRRDNQSATLRRFLETAATGEHPAVDGHVAEAVAAIRGTCPDP